MFAKNENEPIKRNGDTETIIGPSVQVKGNFVGEGNVTVEGRMEGTLETKNNLVIGKGAEVVATVKAKNIYVAGRVEGNIKATEKMELSASSVISGDIETKYLSVESGAVFNGQCVMGEGAQRSNYEEPEENNSQEE